MISDSSLRMLEGGRLTDSGLWMWVVEEFEDYNACYFFFRVFLRIYLFYRRMNTCWGKT
jgi:hypothetical protein